MKQFTHNNLLRDFGGIIIGSLLPILAVMSWTLLAEAAVCSNPSSYSDGQVLTASQLNGSFNTAFSCINAIDNSNISTNANIDPLKINPIIDGDGLTRSGVSGALSVVTDNTTIEINSDTLQTKDGGVSTAKIADGAVTGVKLNANTVDDSTIQLSSNQLKVKDGGITIAKLAAVTSGSTATAGNLAVSSVLNFTTSSTSAVDVTSSSITLTTTGRPVLLVLAGGTDTGVSPEFYIRNTNTTSTYVEFVRGSTMLSTFRVVGTNGEGASSMFLDIPAAGTYTYKLRMYAGANTAQMVNGKFWAFEL